MLQLLKFLIIIYLLLINVKSVHAFDFKKYSDNPLKIEYNSTYSDILQAHIYKDKYTYKGILTAKQSSADYYELVELESIDGIEWKFIKKIYSDSNDVSNARLFTDSSGNNIILFAKQESPDFYRIYWLACSDDLTCTEPPKLLLDPDRSNLNENHGHFAPFLLNISDKYYLFYGAWGNNGFSIKMAFSDHFGDWQKCNEPLFLGADGPFPFLDENTIFLYFHRSNSSGIQAAEASFPLNCSTQWTNLGYVIEKTEYYDINHIVFPSLVETDDESVALYYSGKGQDNVWRLNMAIETSLPTPTLTPTPTSTPSPTPTHTPTPTPTPQLQRNPIIIIPGMMSTWNKEAIIHRKLVSQSEWKLTSFVKEYDALIDTLKTLNYVENKDYFLFAYDWRKPVDSLTEELNNYIKIHLPNESEFLIIGHSFGGLIARIYQQKYTNDYLKSIVTAGSPLKGAPQAYKAVSAGEIDQDNTIIWLAQKIVLQLYRDQLMTDKQIINENFHSIKDLLPVFNYLRDINGEEIDSSMLTLKNDLLSLYEDRLVDLYPILSTLSGNRIRTIAGYTVSGQNVLDKLLGNYIDGRPTNGYFDEGDGLVLTKSSSMGNNTNLHDFNHGEVIYKKSAIKSILDSLNIPHEDTQIAEGRGTIISPSLIFIIKSPAEMEVKIEDKVYKEKDGIIYVENASDGEYELFVHGKNRGMYEILIGAIGVSSNSWNTINGEITSIIPQLETDRYKISFNSDKPVDYFVDLNEPTKLINELILYFKQNVNINKKIINELSRLRYYITQKKYKHATKLIILIDKHLVKNREYYALEKLENIYSRIQTEPSKKRTLIDKKFDSIKNDFIKKQSKLLKSKNNRTKLIVLELINKKIKTAEDNIKNVNYSYAEIVLVSISNLMEIL